MLWLWYIALWIDLIGLVPGARAEARLLRVDSRRQPARPASRRSPSVRRRLPRPLQGIPLRPLSPAKRDRVRVLAASYG
jgi:hypothetical protein